METVEKIRHRCIQRMTSVPAQQTADVAIVWWDSLATQIIAIVGEAGFNSLYARSVHLAQSRFPWLTIDTVSAPSGNRFDNLKTSLTVATPELANQANSLLLTTFTDILASLIGEPVTARILDSAWGVDPLYKTRKELKNE